MSYLNSTNIKVYPTAYRAAGANNPEASLNTERNLADARKLSCYPTLNNYVEDSTNYLHIYIQGYYFKLDKTGITGSNGNHLYVAAGFKTLAGQGGAYAENLVLSQIKKVGNYLQLENTYDYLDEENDEDVLVFKGLYYEVSNTKPTPDTGLNIQVLDVGTFNSNGVLVINSNIKTKLCTDEIANSILNGAPTKPISDTFNTITANITTANINSLKVKNENDNNYSIIKVTDIPGTGSVTLNSGIYSATDAGPNSGSITVAGKTFNVATRDNENTFTDATLFKSIVGIGNNTITNPQNAQIVLSDGYLKAAVSQVILGNGDTSSTNAGITLKSNVTLESGKQLNGVTISSSGTTYDNATLMFGIRGLSTATLYPYNYKVGTENGNLVARGAGNTITCTNLNCSNITGISSISANSLSLSSSVSAPFITAQTSITTPILKYSGSSGTATMDVELFANSEPVTYDINATTGVLTITKIIR